MKHKFIQFLKEQHALQEFLMEIVPECMDDLDVQFSDGGAEFVLCDGAFFFYKNAKTTVELTQSLIILWPMYFDFR